VINRTVAQCGRVEREGFPCGVYFISASGSRWRVYDRLYERMVGWHAVTPPAEGADHRVFVPERGVKRVFQFEPLQTRGLTPALLEVQLRSAEDMVVESTDSISRSPW
jgi:hypothetical protein